MSRFSSWLLAILLSAFTAAGASACPGLLAIGLPLLFGAEETTSSPQSTAGFDEAQEQADCLDRKAMAQECLKIWRQLVRDGRFDIAPTVAAKAALLDPTNADVQKAVMVSQVLRGIGETARPETNAATKATAATSKPRAECELEICPGTIRGIANGLTPAGQLTPDLNVPPCPACPLQCPAICPADVKIAQPKHSIQFMFPLPFVSTPNLPGSGFVIKYLTSAVPPRPAPPMPVKVESANCDHCPTAPATENKVIVDRTLNHLFPGGLLTGACDSAPAQCGSLMFGAGVNCDAGLVGSIRAVSHTVPKRVSITTSAMQVECDRVLLMNEREMIVEGNVHLTMRQRDVTVRGGRVRVDLTSGSLQVEGAGGIQAGGR
jgi:hypothetical protein